MHYQRRRVGELDDARIKFEMNTMLPREVIDPMFTVYQFGTCKWMCSPQDYVFHP